MSTFASSSSVRITPLTKENYYAWKQKMMALLIDAELWPYVIGMKKRPAEEGQEANEWDMKDQRALAAIVLRVSDDYLVYLDGMPTSADAWRKLRNIFESKGALTVTNLWRKLFRLQASDDTIMEDHIRLIQDYLRNLRNRGERVEDATIKNIILASLPETDFWENFTMSITIAKANIDSDDLIAKLLSTDQLKKAESSTDTALKTQERHGRVRKSQ